MARNSRDRASATQGSAITNPSSSISCLFTLTHCIKVIFYLNLSDIGRDITRHSSRFEPM